MRLTLPNGLTGEVGDCKQPRGCGRPIVWIVTAAGRNAPYDMDGTSHWATCPNVKNFRKPGDGYVWDVSGQRWLSPEQLREALRSPRTIKPMEGRQ